MWLLKVYSQKYGFLLENSLIFTFFEEFVKIFLKNLSLI